MSYVFVFVDNGRPIGYTEEVLESIEEIRINVLMAGYSRHVKEMSRTITLTRTIDSHSQIHHRRSIRLGVSV